MVQPLSKGSVDVCRELSLMNQDRHAGVLHRRPPASISFEFGLTEWTATVAELAIGRNARSVEGAWRASGTDVKRMAAPVRSEEQTSELQSLMRHSYAVFCLKKQTTTNKQQILSR